MRSRSASHNTEDWNYIRPHFVDLYIRQGKTLKEVIRILDVRYSFKATPKQFKVKIEEWKIGKHCNERDALHVLRKIRRTEAQSQRGKIVVKLRGRPTGIDKVIKHFERKNITSLDAILERLPRSPTPSVISCEEIEDVSQSSPASSNQSSSASSHFRTPITLTPSSSSLDSVTASFLDMAPANMFPDLSWLETDYPASSISEFIPVPRTPRAMQTSLLEQGLSSLKNIVRIKIRPEQKDCSDWWETSRTIAGDLINARGYLYSGRLDFAMLYYEDLLKTATSSVRTQDMTLLQLIAHLFSWATYPQYASLVQCLLVFLARLKSAEDQPVLSLVARSLVTDSLAPRKVMARYMECMTEQLDLVLGPDSVMVLWMKVRLCRHLHAVGEIASAVRLLDQVDHIWRIHRDSTPKSLLLKMDRELGVTFYQFGDFRSSRYHLTQALEGFDVKIGGVARNTYLLQRLAACNVELGFPELALSQARLGLTLLEEAYHLNYPWTENLRTFISDLEQQMASIDILPSWQQHFAYQTSTPRIISNNSVANGNNTSVFVKYFPGDSYDATFVGKTACFDDGVLAQYGHTLAASEDEDHDQRLWSSLHQLSMDNKHSQPVSLSIVDMQESTAGADLCIPDAPMKPFDD